MALYQLSPARGAAAGTALPHLVGSVCFALIVSHVVFLLASLVKGDWLIGHDGGVASDFVNVWAAGKLALGGHAASAYDWAIHKAAEESAVGHPFDGYFGWHYPPTFLFVAIPLSLLPYAVAYVVWVFGTFPAYLAAIRAIIGDRIAYMLAAAFPAVLANFVVGQNGFLSAGLIGGTLVLLERRALLAGVLLGLLTYKPHLGLLFPIALIAGWHWRAFLTAGIVATLMAAAAWAAFGTEAWRAFAAGLGKSSQAFLSDGWADFGKLQTAFGLTRTLGGSETLAWSVQAGVVVLAAAAIAVALAQPRQLRDQGRGARRRRDAGDAVSLYVRRGGAGGAARLSHPPRPLARLPAARARRHGLCLFADRNLPVREGAGRFRRRPHRGRPDRAPRAHAAA